MGVVEDKFSSEHLQENLESLFHYIQRVRQEIAALNQSADGVDKFTTMGDQVRHAMRFLVFVYATTCMVMAGLPSAVAQTRWVVYYAAAAPVEAFSEYSLIVLDADHHPALGPLSARGKLLLGYISLGEVERHRSHFSEVEAEGILLQENKQWPGSYFVDLRDSRWTQRVVEELVPGILRRGFDGLFLDTLDNAGALERADPTGYAGMTKAAARLVRTIRIHFPTIKIMLNRAYEILPVVEREVDMVLGESVLADYDFEKKNYQRVEAETYRQQIKILQAAKARRPELRILTLDYWNPEDPKGIRQIYREQRANGFEPYVATIKLDRIVPEPGT
jgi:uncharacterized protein (TIGR01370 family)